MEKKNVPDWILFDLNRVLASDLVETETFWVKQSKNDKAFRIQRKKNPAMWMEKEMEERARTACFALRELIDEEVVKDTLKRFARAGLDGWMKYTAAGAFICKILDPEKYNTLMTHAKRFGM